MSIQAYCGEGLPNAGNSVNEYWPNDYWLLTRVGERLIIKLVKWSDHYSAFNQVMSSLEPIKKSAIAEEISNQLLSMIKEKQLRPGDKLPPERELAAILQVSRPSLREALRALAIMNIIEIRQGDGTYVTSLDPGLLVEHLEFILSLDDSTFLQLLEARKIVEVGIASLAAQRITDVQIAELETCQAKSVESVDDHEAFLEVDLELHEIITRAACNPFLKRFITSLSHLGLASRRRTARIPGVCEQSVKDHRKIVKELKAHDPEATSLAMLRHLNNVEGKLEYQAQGHETEISYLSAPDVEK